MVQSSVNEQDEIRRKLLKPKVSPDEVDSILNVSFVEFPPDNSPSTTDSSRARVIRELDSYDDANFLVEIDGVKHLLKVQNGVESEKYLAVRNADEHTKKRARVEEKPSNASKDLAPKNCLIDLQTAIYRHLSSPEYEVTTSTIVKIKNHTKDQLLSESERDDTVLVRELSVTSSEHSPQQLVVRLHSWVEGNPLSSLKWYPIETLADCGAYLGRLDHALDELAASNPDVVEASKRYHAWDGKNLLDLESYVSDIDDLSRRNLVYSIIKSFKETIIEGGEFDNFRSGINHGDFNDANILVKDDGDGLRVSGVIDFGDTVHSWRVLDVAVAMAYALISSHGQGHRSLAAACALLRGFHQVYPLTLEEKKHLRLLVACRLAQSVTFGNYTYKKNPQNEYILLHSKPAWEALHFIWGADGKGANGIVANVVDNAFEIACENIYLTSNCSIPGCVDISFPDPSVFDPFAAARAISSKVSSSHKIPAEPHIITFVTGNKKKAEEVRRILTAGTEFPFQLTNHKVDLPELQGEMIEIAREKCALAAKEMNGAVITEDTSLCFKALNDLPGPYIKWFLDKNGLDGLNDMISFSSDKSAYAQTVVAFCPGPGNDVITFDGRTQGKIVRPRGKLDFGWDPIFEPNEGSGLTYAEMTGEQKDAISHRKRAFEKLREFMMQQMDTLSKSICLE